MKFFYSKLILFGEYTVITGGDALAMPLKQYRGFWTQSEDRSLQQNLPAFAEYLSENDFPFLNTDEFKNDLAAGWYFESNIPTGYGGGSSGALVAGIMKKYGDSAFLRKQSILDLKKIGGKMEGFFHGSSSGTDPLISFLNQTVHLKKSGSEVLRFSPKRRDDLTFFLLDTKHPRKTTPFVNYFLEKLKEPVFAEKVDELKVLNRLAIAGFLSKKEVMLPTHADKLKESFEKISRLQFDHFQKMIPDYLTEIWQNGLENDVFKLKICGAGGGGFMIGLTSDWKATQQQIIDFPIFKLKI